MIPVAFVQFGKSDCLESCVLAASKFGHDIYIISDNRQNNIALPGVTFVSMDGLIEGIDLFQRNYVHLSTNGRFNELVCFLRWIVLRNFMRREGIPSIIHLDHDVLLYASPFELADVFRGYSVSIASMCSGHCFFVTFPILEDFVEKMIEIYKNKSCHLWFELLGLFNSIRNTGGNGGACDMTLLRLIIFNKMYCIPGELIETSNPFRLKNELVFIDDNINSPQGCWEMEKVASGGMMKRVYFDCDKPFCWNVHLMTPVRALALHFQGIHGKSEIARFAR